MGLEGKKNLEVYCNAMRIRLFRLKKRLGENEPEVIRLEDKMEVIEELCKNVEQLRKDQKGQRKREREESSKK